jgi:hypothetical protein
LFGDVLEASGFKRWNGDSLLVVTLPDGSPGTVRVEVTDLFAGPPEGPTPLMLDGGGIQRLHRLVVTLRRQRSSRRDGK